MKSHIAVIAAYLVKDAKCAHMTNNAKSVITDFGLLMEYALRGYGDYIFNSISNFNSVLYLEY